MFMEVKMIFPICVSNVHRSQDFFSKQYQGRIRTYFSLHESKGSVLTTSYLVYQVEITEVSAKKRDKRQLEARSQKRTPSIQTTTKLLEAAAIKIKLFNRLLMMSVAVEVSSSKIRAFRAFQMSQRSRRITPEVPRVEAAARRQSTKAWRTCHCCCQLSPIDPTRRKRRGRQRRCECHFPGCPGCGGAGQCSQ